MDGIDKCLLTWARTVTRHTWVSPWKLMPLTSCISGNAVLYSQWHHHPSAMKQRMTLHLRRLSFCLFFCQTLILLNKVFQKEAGTLYIMNGGLLVEWEGGAFLYNFEPYSTWNHWTFPASSHATSSWKA